MATNDESSPRRTRNPPRRRSTPASDATLGSDSADPPAKARADAPAASGEAGERQAGKPPAQARGVVCPDCGKYHDVTASPPGSTFRCYCGKEFLVPPPAPERGVTPRDARARRLVELRTRLLYTNIAMVVSFMICILLISASMYLMLGEGQRGNGICAGLAAIAFLVAGTVAAREGRRTKAEMAGTEEV